MTLWAWVLIARGYRARRGGRSTDAHRHFAQAVAASRRAGSSPALIRALKGLGQIERDLGRGDAALPLYEEAVRICRDEGDSLRLAHMVRHLGDIHQDAGRPELADPCYREALAIYRSDHRTAPLDLANAVRPFAILQETLGKPQQAIDLWTEARDLYSTLNLQAGVEESSEHLAKLSAEQKAAQHAAAADERRAVVGPTDCHGERRSRLSGNTLPDLRQTAMGSTHASTKGIGLPAMVATLLSLSLTSCSLGDGLLIADGLGVDAQGQPVSRATVKTVVAVTALLQLQTAALTGKVLDATDRPVPGATVRISGAGVSAGVVSDRMGRFRIEDLAHGPYVLTVSLAGFRTRTLNVHVDSSANPEWVVKLTTRVLTEVLWVVPPPIDAYRMATAIAHLRIEATRPSGPCGDAYVVTAHHEASTLRVFKGQVPPSVQLHQEAAGRCSERGQWHAGIERPYRAGEEYVVFLAERADGFGRLAGPSLAFRVRGEMVDLEGFAGAQRISLSELGELLDRLSRIEPPDRRLQPTAADAILGRRG